MVSTRNAANDRGFVSQWSLKIVALANHFPLTRVGVVYNADITANFSQEGGMYRKGVAVFCARAGSAFLELDIDGALGAAAAAAFAGLVAYAKGLETVPFVFSSDITYYQGIVKDYFATDPES